MARCNCAEVSLLEVGNLDQRGFSPQTNLEIFVTRQNSTPFTPGSIFSGGLTLKDFKSLNLIAKNLKKLNKAFFVASYKLRYL